MREGRQCIRLASTIMMHRDEEPNLAPIIARYAACHQGAFRSILLDQIRLTSEYRAFMIYLSLRVENEHLLSDTDRNERIMSELQYKSLYYACRHYC